MNLLQRETKRNSFEEFIFVQDFKEYQYNLIEYFMNLIIDYISKQNNNYLKKKKINIEPLSTYRGIYNSDLTEVKIFADSPSEKDKLFLKLYVPTLVNKAFFVLNGNQYVPTMHILDKPITIKKNSIKLFSLFNPITVYLKDRIVTFTGSNIPIDHFLGMVMGSASQDHIDLARKFTKLSTIDSGLNQYFSSITGENEPEKIIEYFEKLFFDNYTKVLYEKCYNISSKDLKLANVIYYALKQIEEKKFPEFIDLKNKRIVFIELLLAPLFKRVGNIAMQTSKGFMVDEIKMDQMEINKNFTKVLHNKYLFDSVNLYSAILQHKVSFVNPGSQNPPSSIANLHPTHRQVLCPVSISAQKPGESVYIIPNTKLDQVGQFLNLSEE